MIQFPQNLSPIGSRHDVIANEPTTVFQGIVTGHWLPPQASSQPARLLLKIRETAGPKVFMLDSALITPETPEAELRALQVGTSVSIEATKGHCVKSMRPVGQPAQTL